MPTSRSATVRWGSLGNGLTDGRAEPPRPRHREALKQARWPGRRRRLPRADHVRRMKRNEAMRRVNEKLGYRPRAGAARRQPPAGAVTGKADRHRGLVARWWAENNLDGPELEFFRPFVEAGQPALDAGCGTGRLLVPYLHAGLDVDATDISADMLALCPGACGTRGAAAAEPLAQAMHELDLPRRYRTIVVCGAFGLGSRRADDCEGLRRLSTTSSRAARSSSTTRCPGLSATGASGRRNRATPSRFRGPTRGNVVGDLELRTRLVGLDPHEQTVELAIRAALWENAGRVHARGARPDHDALLHARAPAHARPTASSTSSFAPATGTSRRPRTTASSSSCARRPEA